MAKKQLLKMSLIAAAFGFSALSLPAFAAHTDACKDDKQKFCSDVDSSDRKAMFACLKKNQDRLSDACKTQMAKHKKHSSSSGSSTGSTAPAAVGTPPSSGAGQ